MVTHEYFFLLFNQIVSNKPLVNEVLFQYFRVFPSNKVFSIVHFISMALDVTLHIAKVIQYKFQCLIKIISEQMICMHQ